jgi:hypothetical protein
MVDKMKASGNIEFWVKIDDEELKKLEIDSLDGTLRFFEDHHEKIKRDIPLKIKRNMKYTGEIRVDSTPTNKYMGYADQIIVTVDDSHYQELKDQGSTMDRYASVGKVFIDVVKQ